MKTQKLKKLKTWIEENFGAGHAFLCKVNEEKGLLVTSENGADIIDYYGEFRGGYPWISEALISKMKKLSLEYDWQNPGAIIVWEE